MLTKVKLLNWFNKYQAVLGKKVKRYTWTTLLMTQYLAMRGEVGEGVQIKPDIIVAGIPVWHINRLGHAVSDEILKYRSMGGIFLAHQKGGKQTFKFTARIFGPMRFITYKLLEALQLLGSEEAKKVTSLMDISQAPAIGDVALNWLSPGDNLIDVEGMVNAGSMGSPLMSYTKDSEFENAEYAFHRTFPIITDTKIYTDMYLETLVCREDVKYGKDVLEIECAFRHYEAPLFFQKSEPNLVGKRKYYTVFAPKKYLAAVRGIEGVINILWAGLMTFYYSTGELAPDIMFQKPMGKNDWEGINLILTMIGHYVFSRLMFPKGSPV